MRQWWESSAAGTAASLPPVMTDVCGDTAADNGKLAAPAFYVKLGFYVWT